jgi:predicted Asp-tRNA(Asn)/Glu-tRNA(Gln) amidotransferase subunit C
MPDEKKVLEEGKKLLEEFSEALKDIPDTEETHYVVDLKNVTRPDAKGKCDPGFRGKFEKLAPNWDYGYVKVEKKR